MSLDEFIMLQKIHVDQVEHGGVVPDWFTEKGQCLLDLLREYSVTIGFDD